MREARAKRKAIVLGSISDYAGTSDRTYVTAARQALEIADRVVFVGNASAKALKARRHERDDALQAFYSAEAAAEHLYDWLRPGDLVLLKGSGIDRLDVIAAGRPPPLRVAGAGGRFRVVVGLGNPGPGYRDTPHNVGQRALDHLASALGVSFQHEADARVARAGDGLVLLAPLAYMNVSGPHLLAIAERMGFGPSDLLLVHDDLDLAIGVVRARRRSGDGGHRGVRSVLQAFRTDVIQRVGIGVGRPARGQRIRDFVLTPFPAANLARVDDSCAEAADRVLERLGRPERVRDPAARAG
jgi:PTH1 family peptidyl-tRNA hydrolase